MNRNRLQTTSTGRRTTGSHHSASHLHNCTEYRVLHTSNRRIRVALVLRNARSIQPPHAEGPPPPFKCGPHSCPLCPEEEGGTTDAIGWLCVSRTLQGPAHLGTLIRTGGPASGKLEGASQSEFESLQSLFLPGPGRISSDAKMHDAGWYWDGFQNRLILAWIPLFWNKNIISYPQP